MSHLKIDVFNHIFPKPFFDRLQATIVNRGAIKRWLNIPFLHDVDVRFRMLEEFGPDYRQILSLSAPPIEAINPDPQITRDLARLANDSQAVNRVYASYDRLTAEHVRAAARKYFVRSGRTVVTLAHKPDTAGAGR